MLNIVFLFLTFVALQMLGVALHMSTKRSCSTLITRNLLRVLLQSGMTCALIGLNMIITGSLHTVITAVICLYIISVIKEAISALKITRRYNSPGPATH